MDKRTLQAIKRECREMAHDIMLEQYQLYDAIWWNRIRISQALYEHGKETVRGINTLMPNLLTHSPDVCTLDLVSERFGFESTSDLVDFLLAYKPRGPVKEQFYEQFLAEQLTLEASPEHNEVDQIPF